MKLNHTKEIAFIFFSICSFICFNIYAQSSKNYRKSTSCIQSGVAKLRGKANNFELKPNEKNAIISFVVYNPVTGRERNFETTLNKDFEFAIDIPIECVNTFAGFNIQTETNFYGNGIVDICLCADNELNIYFDKNVITGIRTNGCSDFNLTDLKNATQAMYKFELNEDWGDYSNMSPNDFLKHELKNLTHRINYALDSLKLSDRIKTYLVNSFNLRFISGRIFEYQNCVEQSHRMSSDTIPYKAVEPKIAYYDFLRSFNLNNPDLLSTYSYSTFIQRLLSIPVLQIPPIKDTPVQEWISQVTIRLNDIVGFRSGLFYDMLAANSYSYQLNYCMNPLSVLQKQNIHRYFKHTKTEFVKILMSNNDNLIKILNQNTDLKINSTPQVAKENLIDTIRSKYKNNVVVIDFWATWCGPCIKGIMDLQPLKSELQNKGINFVYIASTSSPKDRWEAQIKTIGGNHYYLTENEIGYIGNQYNLTALPAYLIFDRKGELKYKLSGFPGIDKMREIINSVLSD